MTTKSRTAQNNNRRVSSPAGDRSSTSASSGGRRVPGAPAGRISMASRRTTDSACQSQKDKEEGAWRSRTWSVNGRPCASFVSAKRAWARIGCWCCCCCWGRERERERESEREERENVLVGVWGSQASSKDSRRGLARTRRAPLVRSESSLWEGTMRSASVRSWVKGRMHRANVSLVGVYQCQSSPQRGGVEMEELYDREGGTTGDR
jgi:hypothetical protein